jgi:hypothetical protein
MVEVDEVCDESIGFGSNYEVLQTIRRHVRESIGQFNGAYMSASLSTISLWWASNSSMSVNDMPFPCW